MGLMAKIKGFFSWLWSLISIFTDKIIVPALQQIGEEGKNFLIEQIKLQTQNNSVSGWAKIKLVADAFKKEYSYKNIANSLLSSIITLLYAELQEKGEVK
jgi:hypothetical protein